MMLIWIFFVALKLFADIFSDDIHIVNNALASLKDNQRIVTSKTIGELLFAKGLLILSSKSLNIKFNHNTIKDKRLKKTPKH
jgi:hypothetical protein